MNAARIEGKHLIIDDCEYCGDQHSHGASDHRPGEITHRTPHCLENTPEGSYKIAVIA